MPDRVLIRIDARAPAEDDHLEPLLLDVLLEKGGPLDGLDIRLDPDLLEALLDQLRELLALLVALVRTDGEGERLAVLVAKDAVAVLVCPSRGGEKLPGLGRIIRIALYLVGVGPGARAVRPRRLSGQPHDHALDQLGLVDGIGKGLSHPLVREARILQVEAEVGVAISGVAVLVVVLLEGRVVGLARVLDGREIRHVHALGLELEKDGGLARDDPVHDAADIRAPLDVVVLVGHEHDLLAALPLLELVRPRAHGIRRVLGRFPELAFLGVLGEEVLGQHGRAPASESLGIGLRVDDPHRVRIQHLDVPHQLEVVPVRRGSLRIHHGLVGEMDVLGGERLAVVPLHVFPQLEGQAEAVLAELPGLGHGGHPVQVLVGLHQPVVDQTGHRVGGRVRGDVGNEPGDIADGSLHEGVAVGGLLVRGGLVGGHGDPASAVSDREETHEGEQSEGEQRDDASAAHVTSSPGGARGRWGQARA